MEMELYRNLGWFNNPKEPPLDLPQAQICFIIVKWEFIKQLIMYPWLVYQGTMLLHYHNLINEQKLSSIQNCMIKFVAWLSILFITNCGVAVTVLATWF